MNEQSKAYVEGKETYLSDDYQSNPYSTGSQEFRDFQDGWWDTHYAELSNYNFD